MFVKYSVSYCLPALYCLPQYSIEYSAEYSV